MKSIVSRRDWWLSALLVATCLIGQSFAWAQEAFPIRPLRLVVPYPPGGSTDGIARPYAELLSKALGQPVIVDNRPGASTNIGADIVAKSNADGYTLLFGGSFLIVNSVLGPKPSFDPSTALTSISTVAEVPFMVAAHPQAPFSNPRQMVDAARAAPGKFSIASAQLNAYVELLKVKVGMDVLHVPYKGGAQATTDAIAGQVQAVFALVPVLLPHVQAGRLRAIGVTSAQRVGRALPDVPAWMESGFDYLMTTWYGVQAPSGVSAQRLARLNAATRQVVQSEEFVSMLAAWGARASASSPATMSDLLAQQRQTWEQLLKTNPELARTE